MRPHADPTPGPIPDRAEIVIIGGGVMGISTAYHLAAAGHTDVVVLEQGRLSSGTTWHAAGLVGQLRTSRSATSLIQYSASLYARLEAETGLATGWRQSGSLQVARTPERLEVLRRNMARAARFGIEADLIDLPATAERWPLLNTTDLVGSVWIPSDGSVNPTDLTQSLARGARRAGVGILEGVRVLDIDTGVGARPRARAVVTDHGTIECDTLVVCAGQWSKAVGRLAGVSVPMHSAEHFYAVTETLPGVDHRLPVLRDPDGCVYFKEETAGLVMGGFEPHAKPWRGPFNLPTNFEFQLLPPDLEQVQVLIDNAIHRVPALGEVGIRAFINGPESFTPDNQPLLGRAPEVNNLFVGAGFNSTGIALSGGAGRALAEWIIEGHPTQDLAEMDMLRFTGHEDNEAFLRARVVEALGLHYAMPWPNRQLSSARPLRRSPVHEVWAAAGAFFTTESGWEVPYLVDPTVQQLTHSFGREPWLRACLAEQALAIEHVALFDLSAHTGLLFKGPDAAETLSALVAAPLPHAPGSSVQTAVSDDRGGHLSEVTVLATAPGTYLLLAPSGVATRLTAHIEAATPASARAVLVDVSAAHSVIGMRGPAAPALLAAASLGRCGIDGRAEIGTVSGWVVEDHGDRPGLRIVTTSDVARTLAAHLLDVGRDLHVGLAGSAAREGLRISDGVAGHGQELLIGAATSSPPVTTLLLEDTDATLWGGEQVWCHGQPVGALTSGAVSYQHGRSVGLLVVPPDLAVETDSWTIEVMGTRLPARQATATATTTTTTTTTKEPHR